MSSSIYSAKNDKINYDIKDSDFKGKNDVLLTDVNSLLNTKKNDGDEFIADENDEFVPCSYCNQPTYEESYVLLSCFHRYHYSCVLNNISAITITGDFMTCKVCGFKSAVLGKTGIPIARNLGFISKKGSLGSLPKSLCSTCQFRASTVYCIDCCEGFCTRCVKEFHNSVLTLQNHIIRQLGTVDNEETIKVNSAKDLSKTAKEEKILFGINRTETNFTTKQIQKKKKKATEEYCIVHKRTEAKYFCLTCEHNCFCEVCATVGMHRDHKVLMASEAIDFIRDILGQFQHFAIKRISELDSVQDSTSEWKKRQQMFLEEVKPQLENNSVQACQTLAENTNKFKNELLKEWFEGEDAVLREINDAKKKYEELKQLITSLHNCLDKSDEYMMMNFLHEKYKEVYTWLDKPFNDEEFTKFTDPIICYERIYNMTDRMNRETANLISQQVALNRLNCIFQPRKFQCNFESDIITFDDDGIAIPILSSEKISYSSNNNEENKNSEKSIIKIGGEIFNNNFLNRKKQDIQVEKSVSLEILQKDNELNEFEDNTYDALYEKMLWLHPSKQESLNESLNSHESEIPEISSSNTETEQENNCKDQKKTLEDVVSRLESFSLKKNTQTTHSEDESFISNLCFDMKKEFMNALPRFDILYSRRDNPCICK